MRKLFLIATIAIFAVTSCKQEYENWYSAGYELSGEWVVTVQQSDDESTYISTGEGAMPDVANIANWTWVDYYGTGTTSVLTYSSAANTPTELIVDDNHTFWDYKIKVNANIDAKTFAVDNTPNLAYDDCNVSIIGGKILEGAATTPGGNVADSILFYVKFSDNREGFTYMKVSGFRKTGFDEDTSY
ncbi:MAG: hypothetical protein LBV41_04755 [Cytophagaceae bacterium]|jgi:hypothetical protein|nr:hypothetical protein [Cytophagaceae bacterium]